MKKQRGAALVVVLSMLAMALMLGLSGMQSSQVDERLAGNYKASAEAQMGAERAVSVGWGAGGGAVTNNAFNTGISRAAIASYSWHEFSSLGAVSTNVCTGNVQCRYYFLRDGSDLYIVAMGAVVSDGVVVGASLPVFAEVVFDTGPNPAFTNGLLSADYIHVTGQSTVHGNVHSNGTVDIKLRSSSNATVSDGSDGMVEVPLPGSRPVGEDMSACDVTSPPAYCYKSYEPAIFSQFQQRSGVINSCNVSIAALADGSTVYCNGDLTVQGGSIDSRKVTLVATGNVTMNGATSSDGAASEIGLFVIAGQDITFNGSTDNYGVFWAGGYVRQNGNSNLYGSIVAGTYIRSNGGIDFTSVNNVTNPDTHVPLTPRLVAWN
ncbi:MAG: PilX N-terminal domain-containing pilus assembly protein [Halomonadaceae bacterium]|jgi:hypothetical protein